MASKKTNIRPRGNLRVERILSLITETRSCWLWNGRLNGRGYGTYGKDLVHRILYQAFVGPITKRTLNHLCEIKRCVRPYHLVPATYKENIRYSDSTLASINSRKTMCPQKHSYNKNNTYTDLNGRMHCRICMRFRTSQWYHTRGKALRRGRRRPGGDKEKEYVLR